MNLRELFNAKAILKEQLWYFLTHSCGYKGVQWLFVIARLEFELEVQNFNHYATKIPPDR